MVKVLRAPGLLLGAGLGGFVDGIVLHQVLQWHHLLTSTDSDRIGLRYYSPDTVPGLRMNTLWDGIFHVVTWLLVLSGLALLYARLTTGRRQAWTSGALWGWILVGWGLFNVVEGLVDHQLLGVHHVRTGPHQVWWDLGFLLFGVVLIGIGWTMRRGTVTAARL
jgi:uncharacterized membrane protein